MYLWGVERPYETVLALPIHQFVDLGGRGKYGAAVSVEANSVELFHRVREPVASVACWRLGYPHMVLHKNGSTIYHAEVTRLDCVFPLLVQQFTECVHMWQGGSITNEFGDFAEH